MADFLVSWVIDMDDCATPQEAAERALTVHRKPDSIATVFEVKDKATGETVTVDLDPDEGLDAEDDDDEGYPPRCTNATGHEWPNVEEHEASRCVHCGADGDA